MEEVQASPEPVSVESINTQIEELRQSQPANEYKSGTIEQTQFQEKKKALYAQRLKTPLTA